MKKAIAILVSLFAIALSITAFAANTAYTFKGVSIITDGSPNDITDVQLTNDIKVTTSGNMNRKHVGVTDKAHNNQLGTYPINDSFKATGSYIYLGTANANDGSIITLKVPEIKAGSEVKMTFAKPVVTNNGSTLRNTNDPYAYLQIADRYITINGDNFDTWRTETVVTGEDTDEIVFYADKWGAVAISKIEITEGVNTSLHSLNISSTQYANLIVNGIKFCADESGKITLPSYPEGENVTIKAYKDGYADAEQSITVGKEDAQVSIPLVPETNSEYYESDFGNTDGALTLDGEYKFADGIAAREVTRIFARVDFEKDGYLDINTDSNIPVRLSYNGEFIRVGDNDFVQKDNLEFELFYDRKNNAVFIKQADLNRYDRYQYINNVSHNDGKEVTINTVNSVSGKGATLEYIGISYPDTTKLTIEGADRVASPISADYEYICVYTATPEYCLPGESVVFSGQSDCATIETASRGRSTLPVFVTTGKLKPNAGASGKITITAEYNGAKATKEVEIINNPTIAKYANMGEMRYANLHSSELSAFIDDAQDENGTKLEVYTHYTMKDFKSSDENVIKVNEEGRVVAVGKGSATVTYNAYTGRDNIITLNYTVDEFYKYGWGEASTTYVTNDFEGDHITGYRVSWYDGNEDIEPTQIPAATVQEDGVVLTVNFDMEKKIRSVTSAKVKKGDKVLPTNEAKKVYFCNDNGIELIEKGDTTVEGFAVTSVPKGIYYEISPVYTYENIGDVAEGVTLDGVFPCGPYDLTFKKGETWRGDIYVNGFMAGNNVDQCDADRHLDEGSEYTVKRFQTVDTKTWNNDGKITVSMTDGSTVLDSVTVSRAGWQGGPTIYIIGDSFVCNYYGAFDKEVGGGRTGLGQVLDNFVNANIVNLANSGQFAKGLYETAFPSVVNNSPNYALIECGYNDRSYSTRDEMIDCVKKMITECREACITPILVTPNASQHDYKESVVWSSYLRDIAVDMDCPIIDLSKESYDFLYSLYGDNEGNVIEKNYNLTEVGGDNLHSSYAAAMKWASIVAQNMKDMNLGWEELFNTDFAYTFTDTEGNKITAKIE